MKGNWLTNFLVLLVGCLVLAYPLGRLYSNFNPSSSWFISVDPNNLFSGSLIALAFIASYLAIVQKKWQILSIVILIIIFDMWGGLPYDLRLDLYAALAGLALGFATRALFVKTKSKD